MGPEGGRGGAGLRAQPAEGAEAPAEGAEAPAEGTEAARWARAPKLFSAGTLQT